MRLRGVLEPALRPGSRWLWLVWTAVPLLCVLAPGLGVIASFCWIGAWRWLGAQPLASFGLRRPTARTFVQASGLAIALYLFAEFLMDPALERWLDVDIDTSAFANLTGDWQRFLSYLALGWIVGGLIEESVLRGFLIQYGERLFGAHSAWPLGVFGAVLFGFSHLYQGPAGMVSTGVLGVIFAALFIRSGRNLTLAILTHGLLDSIYFVLAFAGVRQIHQA